MNEIEIEKKRESGSRDELRRGSRDGLRRGGERARKRWEIKERQGGMSKKGK